MPTQGAIAGGLLVAMVVVLVSFGSVVVQITDQSDLAREAGLADRHARAACESHGLAVARESCRQSVAGALRSH